MPLTIKQGERQGHGSWRPLFRISAGSCRLALVAPFKSQTHTNGRTGRQNPANARPKPAHSSSPGHRQPTQLTATPMDHRDAGRLTAGPHHRLSFAWCRLPVLHGRSRAVWVVPSLKLSSKERGRVQAGARPGPAVRARDLCVCGAARSEASLALPAFRPRPAVGPLERNKGTRPNPQSSRPLRSVIA